MSIEEQKRLAEEILFSDEKAPSFAKKLYFGKVDPETILPYPYTLKEGEEVFIENVKLFAEKEIDADWNDRNQDIPDSVIGGLRDLGVFGMTVPKEFGGLGMSQYAYCRVIEELAAVCASTALFVSVHQSIGLKALLLFGTKEQQEKWLKPLARADFFAAFALTEPNAGSDAAGIETRAEYDPERKLYRINGQKQWITNGGIAKVLTVMAKTEDDKVTAFLVTSDMQGFEVTEKALEKVGMRGTKTAKLKFTNMEVPEENILGEKGKGLKVALTVLDYGRTTFGAMCTGAAKYLEKRAVLHAKTRQQFNRPLASFLLVKKKIAKIAAYTYAIEATTYMTAGLIDKGVEDIMLESALLKVFASDSLWDVIYETMQIFGGRSFFTDEPFERMMRDARLNQIGEGANEVMRAFIGVVGMRDVGMQMKSLFDALKNPFADFSKLKEGLMSQINLFRLSHIDIDGEVSQEALELSRTTRQFGFAVAKILGKYREDVIEKQFDLDRVATCAMALYTTSAVISKIATDRREKRASATELAVAKLYCHEAFKTIRSEINSLFDKRDHEIEKVSDIITGWS